MQVCQYVRVVHTRIHRRNTHMYARTNTHTHTHTHLYIHTQTREGKSEGTSSCA